MTAEYLEWHLVKSADEGEWHVFKARTTKPFERFKLDATRGVLQGLSAFFSTHAWSGTTCHVKSLGAESLVSYDEGEVVCRVRTTSFIGSLLRDKILSDVAGVTMDVCGLPPLTNKDVFVVHGRNQTVLAELQQYLRSLGLNPVILDEQNDLGLTIVDKFELFASACSFAFVLMTPDDRIVGAGATDSQWRARQNVILELGWFMARLTRDRVVILFSGQLEIPSDITGVLYLQFEHSIREVSDKLERRLRGVGLLA